MTALIIIASILLFFAIILLQEVKIRLVYKDDFNCKITVAFFKVYPRKEKKKKEKAVKKKKKEKVKEEEKQSFAEKKEALFDLLKVLKKILPSFKKKVRLISRKFSITVGGEEAAKTALICAELKIAAIAVFDFIDTYAIVSDRSLSTVSVAPDFFSTETVFDIDFDFRVRISKILRLAIKALIEFIKLKIKKEMKKGN